MSLQPQSGVALSLPAALQKGRRVHSRGACGGTPVLWSAVAERSDDTALGDTPGAGPAQQRPVANLRCKSGVALRFPPHSQFCHQSAFVP
jgi:hypothetical protein